MQPCSKNEHEFDELELDQLVRITTLGVGGFGRVELVHKRGDPERSFALKRMKKMQVRWRVSIFEFFLHPSNICCPRDVSLSDSKCWNGGQKLVIKIFEGFIEPLGGLVDLPS